MEPTRSVRTRLGEEKQMLFLCLLLGLSMQGPQSASVPAQEQNSAKTTSQDFPLSTKSPEARMAEAVADFRKATQADPNFAVAHLFLSALTTDPEEQNNELKKALALRDTASPDEQL